MLKHFEKIKWDFDVQSKEWVSQSGRQSVSQLVSQSVIESNDCRKNDCICHFWWRQNTATAYIVYLSV
jgi:hypothetical protein